jgi:hypothetical protein
MFGFQHEIVPAAVWLELLDKGAASNAVSEAVLHELIEI